MKKTSINQVLSALLIALAITVAASAQMGEIYRISQPYSHKNLTIFLIHGKDAVSKSNVMTLQEAMERIERLAKKGLAAVEQGDTLQVQLSVLKKLMRAPQEDTIARKRTIAAKVKEAGRYVV